MRSQRSFVKRASLLATRAPPTLIVSPLRNLESRLPSPTSCHYFVGIYSAFNSAQYTIQLAVISLLSASTNHPSSSKLLRSRPARHDTGKQTIAIPIAAEQRLPQQRSRAATCRALPRSSDVSMGVDATSPSSPSQKTSPISSPAQRFRPS